MAIRILRVLGNVPSLLGESGCCIEIAPRRLPLRRSREREGPRTVIADFLRQLDGGLELCALR